MGKAHLNIWACTYNGFFFKSKIFKKQDKYQISSSDTYFIETFIETLERRMQTEVAIFPWYNMRHRQASVSGYIWGNKNRFFKKGPKKKIECGSWLPQQPKFGVACSFLLPTGGELCLCGLSCTTEP